MSAVSTGDGKLGRVGTYGVIPCQVGTTQSVNTKLHSLTLKYCSICFLKAELKCRVAESESVGIKRFLGEWSQSWSFEKVRSRSWIFCPTPTPETQLPVFF